jgi:polyribonucleotide nucleotidyltransferase
VHISKLSRERIGSVGDILREGQEIPVKLMEIDKMGRLNLSYIDAIDPDGSPAYEPRHDSRPPRGGYDRPPRRDGHGDRGGGRGGDRPRYR